MPDVPRVLDEGLWTFGSYFAGSFVDGDNECKYKDDMSVNGGFE